MPENTTDKTSKNKTIEPSQRITLTDNEMTYELEYPITLGAGAQVIKQITIRKPYAGEMRGLSLQDIVSSEVDTISTLLPRITSPIIHKQMVDELDPVDLNVISRGIVSFFSTKNQRMELVAQMESLLKQ